MALDAFICDAVRTPIGRYAGALATVRTDDLAAAPLRALKERNSGVDWASVDDVLLGCVNQAGEDNRNVARMAALLAGLPPEVSAVTVNRLCGSGLDAVINAARAVRAGEMDLVIAGGVESMSRAPLVIPKSPVAFGRDPEIHDTTIGWRFINARMQALYGTDSMPQTADHVAAEFGISREDQERFALRSQERAAQSQANGFFDPEIVPITVASKRGSAVVNRDEHPRSTSLDALSQLRPINAGGTVTAGTASGINDGACALIIASEQGVRRNRLVPRARILGGATAGVLPRIMGIGPVPATRKLLHRLKLTPAEVDTWELNEAFAAQALACMRQLGLADDAPNVNPHGGAIALGHPLGMSGARLIQTAVHQLETQAQRTAVCSMCIGVGQGISIAIERV
jgi:acetyl-CoA acyltransferase